MKNAIPRQEFLRLVTQEFGAETGAACEQRLSDTEAATALLNAYREEARIAVHPHEPIRFKSYPTSPRGTLDMSKLNLG